VANCGCGIVHICDVL